MKNEVTFSPNDNKKSQNFTRNYSPHEKCVILMQMKILNGIHLRQ